MSLLSRLARAATALAAAAALVLSAPAFAEPAMWVVKDKDSTIYLFGTVHILPEDLKWRSPKLEAALAESKELYLEIAGISSVGTQIVSAIMLFSQGLSFSKPLSARLTPEQYASLDRAARKAGLTAQSLNVMRPWMAGMMLQAGQIADSGADPNSGVDVTLEKQFIKAGKPVKGLETVGDQVRAFSTLPEKDEVAFLLDTLETMDESNDGFDDLVGAWASGDTKMLEKAVVTDMKAESDGLYQALLAKRNANWVKQIEAMLAGSGTTFIAVGAGHLVGPDSVQAGLKARGIEATRQ